MPFAALGLLAVFIIAFCSPVSAQQGAPESVPDETPDILETVEEAIPLDEEGPVSILPPALGGRPAVGPILPERPDTVAGRRLPVEDAGEDVTVEVPLDGDVELFSDAGVTVIDLKQLDPSDIGILDDGNGGLGAGVWQGSDRRSVIALLSAVPDSVRSPSLRSLLRQVVLTRAVAPSTPAARSSDDDPYDFLRARLERLVKNGYLSDLTAMVDQIPPHVSDPALTRLRVDTLMLSNNFRDACRDARKINQQDDSPYWLKVVAYCRILDGDLDGASFAADVLREMGVEDALFFELMQRLSLYGVGERDAVPLAAQVGDPTPLKLSMLRAANVTVPLDALVSASPLTLNAIATTPSLPVEQRLEAAHLAARLGALAPGELGEIFGSVAFSDEEYGNALVLVEADIGARGEALVFQSARRSRSRGDRLTYLAAAMELAERSGTYLLGAALNAEVLAAMKPGASDLAFVRHAVRALLVSGRVERAHSWYEKLRVRAEAGGGNVDATSALLDLWPLMQLAGSRDAMPWSENILALWWQARLVETRTERARKAQLLFSALEAFENAVPSDQWAQLYSGAAARPHNMPATTFWRSMMAAAQDGRIGETVLLAAIVIGEQNTGEVNAVVLSNVLMALRQVGFENEARALALEAAIAAGI